MNVTIKAINSAITMDIQMPSTSKTKGRSKMAAVWNTKVLKKEMSAETRPLLRAVKNEEPNIAIPAKRNEKANIENASIVKLYRPLS